MNPKPGARWWLLLLLAALSSLYADALRTGFLNDDYLFLEEAHQRGLLETLTSPSVLGHYFRPLSRQVYFELLTPLAAGHALVFHLVNFAVLLGALVLLADLLRALVPFPGVVSGTVYFALLPLQRVNLTWISCSQDLLALFFSLGAMALFRRRRDGWAALAYLFAALSKESALPLPAALAAWAWLVEPRGEDGGLRPVLSRLRPFALAALAWVGFGAWVWTSRWAALPLGFGLGSFAAGYAHGVQSLLGIDHPIGFWLGITRPGPPPLALVFLLPIGLALRGPVTPGGRARGAVVWFALLWLLAMGLVTGPVAARWSGYYYTLFAVGGAILVGVAGSRLGFAGWLVLATGLIWWHQGAARSREFAVAAHPWGWTSHVTPSYLQRAAALTDTLERQLVALEPKPRPGTRFFFATLPPFAGFQMGNGALIRSVYRDPSIESYFYSQFSESTAAGHPCRFFYWDDGGLAPLYPDEPDRFFQVGSDLLALDHLAGARHAFRRGLAAGENRLDHLYWLGWTELWLLRRGAAEAAWSAFGAKDDSVEWHWQMRRARQALNDTRDTLAGRRALAAAIRSGIGRPEAHAVLGHLLLTSRPKYGLLELKVATYLKPDDWLARRELVLGLYRERLDDQARRELDRLAAVWPDWRSDSVLVATTRDLERRSGPGAAIVGF